jgi:carbon monoxide dehydrogenase subunit G
MLIESDFEVAAPVDQVWRYLLDVPRMAPNLPGAELTEVIDENTYRGRVTSKLGPVSLRFAGIAKVVEQDAAAHRVLLNASGAEERGKGQASMDITATLVAVGAGTKVRVVQDLQVSGAAAHFGRGMIADVTNVLMRGFAANVADDIGRWSRGEARKDGSSAPAQGLAIGVQATLAALKRVWHRFFGRYDVAPVPVVRGLR